MSLPQNADSSRPGHSNLRMLGNLLSDFDGFGLLGFGGFELLLLRGHSRLSTWVRKIT